MAETENLSLAARLEKLEGFNDKLVRLLESDKKLTTTTGQWLEALSKQVAVLDERLTALEGNNDGPVRPHDKE